MSNIKNELSTATSMPSAHGSAAKKSTNKSESKSLPTTPTGDIKDEVSLKERVNKPSVTSHDKEDPINLAKSGSPIFVNPAMFANPFQPSEFIYPPNGNWFYPNMAGSSPMTNFIPGGNIPSQSSATANDDMIAGNLINKPSIGPNTMLIKIKDSSEFSAWIKNFIVFLSEKGLTHLIPDENGNSATDANEEEKRFVIDIFKFFVSPSAYPKWFSTTLNEHFIELYDVIERALYKENEIVSERMIANELFSIYYDGKSDPFFFQRKLENLRKKGEEIGISITDNVISDRIVQHLSGHFKPIADNYDRNYPNITLQSLLNEISHVYIRQVKGAKKVTPTAVKPNTVTTEKSTASASDITRKGRTNTPGKGKRLFHIQDATEFEESNEDLRRN
ncbi:hypothetical protein [Leuconostoc falkenbergense]|uniref:hypothetical protein n=1 Tax=Leuconostoc falkenbergense TaxID=2766470 RepID=UPI003BB05BD0